MNYKRHTETTKEKIGMGVHKAWLKKHGMKDVVSYKPYEPEEKMEVVVELSEKEVLKLLRKGVLKVVMA